MQTHLFIKVHPVFKCRDEQTGEEVVFRNWRENIVDVMAKDVEQAKQTAALTGIMEGKHYNDIVIVE
jgi:hypothetical protein